jgi:CheY-like chemotaxis protein
MSRAEIAPEELRMSESPAVPVIAVVDDDESVRESLAGLAESVGYEAVLFGSAEEFLKSARHRNDVDCLILDVRLPGMSGVELHNQLTVAGWFVPTILITAPAIQCWLQNRVDLQIQLKWSNTNVYCRYRAYSFRAPTESGNTEYEALRSLRKTRVGWWEPASLFNMQEIWRVSWPPPIPRCSFMAKPARAKNCAHD